MSERLYLPTFADLVDRLSICQLKAIFIPEHKEEYRAEMALIMHDIDLIMLAGGHEVTARMVRAAMVIMLANRVIWESESKARAGGTEQDKLLKFTHSINGVRNTAKNIVAEATGERKDWKIDALAANLPEEFGDWNIFSTSV